MLLPRISAGSISLVNCTRVYCKPRSFAKAIANVVLPGMGKTTLAMALAKVLGLQYTRVQFTSDMLPADILGSSIFDSKDSSFRFHKGPIFSQLLLADEINRSTPKTQSALLEAMSERSVSVDGQSLHLPEPFF